MSNHLLLMAKWLQRSCRSSSVSGCVCIGLLFVLGSFPALVSAQEAGPREVRERLRQALNQGAFEDAIPLLHQLLDWFGDSTKSSTQRDLQNWRFQLGLCHYLSGQFGASEPAFHDYLKRYPEGAHASEAAVYLGDGLRFSGRLEDAVRQYEKALSAYRYTGDWHTDILCSMARCFLAREDWGAAIPLLQRIQRTAPDDLRGNWAVTLLSAAYLKQGDLDRVWQATPALIDADSPAARSVVFNLTALETGDLLFAEERYREALWAYRLVHPKSAIERRGVRALEELREEIADLRESPGMHRPLLRAQETAAELEADLEALGQVDDYDNGLRERIARAYMQTRRFREARVLFLNLRSELDGTGAEAALYFAFHCSLHVLPREPAFELGHDYLDTHPKGEFYSAVSLAVGQLYALENAWEQVIEVLSRALQVNPTHEHISECMFLLGYASFMEERFAEAIRWFDELNTTYPGHERIEEATYWLGMAQLFQRNYGPALTIFADFILHYPESPYMADVCFRRAVCHYGLSQFEDAERLLLDLVERYPGSPLLGEACMMLGDVAGAVGASRQAVAWFARALEHELNRELYNYCAFRRIEMLYDLEDWSGIISQCRHYLALERDEGLNPALALYWMSRALWQTGDSREAMMVLIRSVGDYGPDRRALGMDLLLEEWIARSRSLSPAVAREAWRDLERLLEQAREAGETTLVMRLDYVMRFQPGVSDAAREALIARLLDDATVAWAPANVLEFILDEASARGRSETALRAADILVQDFAESDHVIAARLLLARTAIAAREYDVAEGHLTVITETFASTASAARALLLLGNMYLDQRRYAAADAAFERILGVRDWRGPLWPEALFGRAECARLQRQYARAAAFYERIYLLYGHHHQWVSRAYLQRAECLVRLNEDTKAQEVLAEFLAQPALADSPEAGKARERLQQFGRTTP